MKKYCEKNATDMSLMELANTYGFNRHYFKFINACFIKSMHGIVIIDLANALKIGKTCTKYSINLVRELWENEGGTYNIYHALNDRGIHTVQDLYNAVIIGDLKDIPAFDVYTYEPKGVRTFSPFVKIKPIKVPKKWTVSHVWKAILSGQILEGVKEGHYTDDYAYDNAVNFHKGKELDLERFAKNLIEEPSGWRVSAEEERNGVIPLSVNCHHFDYNQLFFRTNNYTKEVK